MAGTWKDEAVAFVLFVLAVVFVARQLAFFVESAKERSVALRDVERRHRWEDQPMQYSRGIVAFNTGSVALIMASGSVGWLGER